jgi:hypothetical protein
MLLIENYTKFNLILKQIKLKLIKKINKYFYIERKNIHIYFSFNVYFIFDNLS